MNNFVTVKEIDFKVVKKGSVRKITITAWSKNKDPIKQLAFSSSEPWLKISDHSKKSPLKVTAEIKAPEPGQNNFGFIVAEINGQKTAVKIKIRTKKPKTAKSQPPPIQPQKRLTPARVVLFLRKTGKILTAITILLLLLALTGYLLGKYEGFRSVIYTSAEKRPDLASLDRWIESDLFPSTGALKNKGYERWYNDTAWKKNDIWVVGGLTFTTPKYFFKTVNYVFHSKDSGVTWETSWQTDKNAYTEFLCAKEIKKAYANEVSILLLGDYASRFTLHTEDRGKTWQVSK
jgi:hypothetical protein